MHFRVAILNLRFLMHKSTDISILYRDMSPSLTVIIAKNPPISAHDRPCLPMCAHVRSCSLIFAHVRLCSLMFAHVCSCSLIFAHFAHFRSFFACTIFFIKLILIMRNQNENLFKTEKYCTSYEKDKSIRLWT